MTARDIILRLVNRTVDFDSEFNIVIIIRDAEGAIKETKKIPIEYVSNSGLMINQEKIDEANWSNF